MTRFLKDSQILDVLRQLEDESDGNESYSSSSDDDDEDGSKFPSTKKVKTYRCMNFTNYKLENRSILTISNNF